MAEIECGAIAMVVKGPYNSRWAREHQGDLVQIVDVVGGPGRFVQIDERGTQRHLYDAEMEILDTPKRSCCPTCGADTIVKWDDE